MTPFTLFTWTGWLLVTGIAALFAVASVALLIKVLWWTVNSRESAFRASASALAAYFYFAIKYRYGEKQISELRDSMRMGDYLLTIEKIED